MSDTVPPTIDLLALTVADLASARLETQSLRAALQAAAAPTPIVINTTKVIDTEYELLPGEIKRAIGDGVKIGGTVVVVLGVLTAVLPSMNLPAADLTVITAASAALTAFLSWAARHGITAGAKA